MTSVRLIGGATPEEALKLFLEALAASDLERALELLTGEQKANWNKKIEDYGIEALRSDFRRMSGPIALTRILAEEPLTDGLVLLRAEVEVQRDGKRVIDSITHTFSRAPDGLWRISSF
jgi:hypothetical protein